MLVAVLIMALYGFWGLIANVALLLHTILTFSALSLIGATLTLPGIAGIILGIGIAVDANILINERIREETRKGLGAMASLDKGFRIAYSTIVDANVTTLIATILLFLFGTGPVRGFAITMMLGIAISMFTAITIVRVIMEWSVRRRKLKVLHIEPFFSFIPENTNFKFMKARFLGIGVSIFLSIASIILFITPGLNYGIDFKGGIQAEIITSQPADLAQLRSTLTKLNLGEVALQTAGSPNNVLIRVQRQDGGEEAQSIAVTKMREAVQQLDPGVKIERTEVVGPKVSGELARSGIIAVVLAAIAMLFYIWWRFEWYFALGAIATLVLDTTKIVGFFALTQLDFNLTAIAALLTIIGYSVNDKVVVYDRMRENLRLYKSKPLREIIDMSINQVLVRCVYTSLTTFLAMLPMAIWGGSAVHNFAIPMLFGIFIATTSSIFIAAPILLFLGDWWQRYKIAHPTEEDTVLTTTK
ncbi:protein translocase subunit SecF, partial [Paraburkholderia aspalathi]|nr:protein translocase subunit SecF [Paraburkholderia aspalathi]